jgi:hypothetical protein
VNCGCALYLQAKVLALSETPSSVTTHAPLTDKAGDRADAGIRNRAARTSGLSFLITRSLP